MLKIYENNVWLNDIILEFYDLNQPKYIFIEEKLNENLLLRKNLIIDIKEHEI